MREKKTVRYKPDRVELDLNQTPIYFYELHKFVTLATDLMFVNVIAFLTTLSRKIILLTVEHIPFHTAAQISIYLTKIVNIYTRVGFIA